MGATGHFKRFVLDSFRLLLTGNRYYYAWIGFLLLLILAGAFAYSGQLRDGLIVSHMRDQVS